jgi:hypothetical protein
MKIVVCISAIVAVWLVHKRPVSPFGNLLGYRAPAHLLDPGLSELRIALEVEKVRRLYLVGITWLAIISAATAAGTLNPPELTAALAAGERINHLAAWPLVRAAAEWFLIASVIGMLAVIGSAFVLWLSLYLLMLARRPAL